MIQKLKQALVSSIALAMLAVPALAFAVPATVSAATSPDINSGLNCGVALNVTDSSCPNNATTSTANLQALLNTVINIFSLIVGVIAVIMIIVGGLRYITSGGDSGKVGAAKTTIIYALVGLVIVALAQLIVHFVLAQAANVVSGGGGAAL